MKIEILPLHNAMNNIKLMVSIGCLTLVKYTINTQLFTLLQVYTRKTTVIVEVYSVFFTYLVIPSLKKILTKIKYV